jgi:hypothetical protein
MGLRPIYLLADSQLLFWRGDDGELFLNSLRERVEAESPKAAYLGASNGDEPTYYALFEAAMESIGVSRRRMILSSYATEDAEFLADSDIILLAGGDAVRGWETLTENGARAAVTKRYLEGALLVGVSAGAAQLGLRVYPEAEFSRDHLIEAFQFVPIVIGAHEEKTGWEALQMAVRFAGEGVHGVGIPAGGGAAYHPDGSLEPIRHPLSLFSAVGEGITHSLLFDSRDAHTLDATATIN